MRLEIREATLIVENKKRTLVLADLHLGIEDELRQRGINIGSQTNKILERVLTCVRATEPDAIVLLGDIKHAVPGVSYRNRTEVPLFLASLAEYAPVYVVKGNHDSHLEGLMPEEAIASVQLQHEVSLERTRGFIFDGVGYTHGHTWPLQELFSADYIMIGHNHPMIRLESRGTGYTKMMSVLIRAKCSYNAVTQYYSRDRDRDINIDCWNDPWVIIMPAFNEICGGVAFNSPDLKLMGPIASKLILKSTMEAYLLDGTYLGRVVDLDR